ncbi:hypothetical protein [Promicromonospora sp. NPDC057488]|uniref:hypothetical protein n=1 Tax=Promicromonospora sp. NPDC057488 TaxID=3346147 RepID=UPI00366EC824
MRTTTQGSDSLLRALRVAADVVATVGEERIETVAVHCGRISLHPNHLAEGEQIAKLLGCSFAMDHRMLVPGSTDWSGDFDGYEVHVRAELRRLVGALG